MSPLQLTQIPPEVEALLTSGFAFAVLLGIGVLKGAMLLRFMPSELVVPTALVLIGSSITDAIMIVLITVVGTTIGRFLLFSRSARRPELRATEILVPHERIPPPPYR